MYIRYFLIISPWKRAWPSFEQTWIPITQGCFVPTLVENGPVVLEKKIKMWKVYRQTDRCPGKTEGRWKTGKNSEKLTWAFNSGELKTQEFYITCGRWKCNEGFLYFLFVSSSNCTGFNISSSGLSFVLKIVLYGILWQRLC